MNIKLNISYTPGIAIIVRDPVTRRKLFHQMYKRSQIKKANQVIREFQLKGMEVTMRNVNVVTNM